MANDFQVDFRVGSGLRERVEARFYGVEAGLGGIGLLEIWIGLSGLAHFLAHSSDLFQRKNIVDSFFDLIWQLQDLQIVL